MNPRSVADATKDERPRELYCYARNSKKLQNVYLEVSREMEALHILNNSFIFPSQSVSMSG